MPDKKAVLVIGVGASSSAIRCPFGLADGENRVHLLLDPVAWLIVVAFSVLGSLGNLALY